ncbi:MAG: tetratricopeptide repeat protein, partial [Saprospiraceae bacterium]
MKKVIDFIFIISLLISCKNQSIKIENQVNNVDSLDYYNHLIDQNPNLDSAYYRRGILLIKQSKLDSGIADLEEAVKINHSKKEYCFSLSDSYLLNLNSKKAQTVLDSFLYYVPDNIPALIKKARLLLILKQHLSALAILDHVGQMDPENSEAYYLAGHIFYEQGDTGRAVKSYQRAVDLNPDFTEGWIQIGDIMTELKNPLALKYYNNAIRLDSNNIETLHNKAFALHNFNKLEEAIQQYKANISKRPDYELSYYNLGIIYQKKDSCLLALKYLDKAIELNDQEA